MVLLSPISPLIEARLLASRAISCALEAALREAQMASESKVGEVSAAARERERELAQELEGLRNRDSDR